MTVNDPLRCTGAHKFEAQASSMNEQLTGEYDLRAITTENWQKYQDKFDDLWAELPPELSLKVAEIVELHKALESVSNI